MNEKQIEDYLKDMKNNIQVNRQLKAELKKSLIKKQKSRFFKRTSVIGALATAVLFLSLLANNWRIGEIPIVKAANLQVKEQYSFVDLVIGDPSGADEYEGTVYIPIKDKGLFAYNDTGYELVSDQQMEDVKISPNGQQIVWAANGSIGTYNLVNDTSTTLLQHQEESSYYLQPTWIDQETILYVKKDKENDFSIYKMNITKLIEKKLTEGSSPTFVNEKNALVFERDNSILFLDLESQEEMVIDQGHSPSVSKHGNYIAYVKKDDQNGVENIWISDTNRDSKRAITANFISETDKNQGYYQYFDPVWSSDSKSIYAGKNSTSDNRISLMRIDLTDQEQSTESVVAAYNEAMIRRDYDFLQLLSTKPQEIMLTTNPHMISYRITESGSENGRLFVDAKTYWGYTANPYYSIIEYRFYLSENENGYKITDMQKKQEVSILETPEQTISIQTEDDKKVLFSRNDIPKEFVPTENYRMASLAYLDHEKSILFAIQILQDEQTNQTSSVILMKYEIESHSFEFIDHISSINDFKNIGIQSIVVSPDEKNVALNLFIEDHGYQAKVLVYNLDTKSMAFPDEQFENTEVTSLWTYYWDHQDLHLSVGSYDQLVHFKWDTENNKINTP